VLSAIIFLTETRTVMARQTTAKNAASKNGKGNADPVAESDGSEDGTVPEAVDTQHRTVVLAFLQHGPASSIGRVTVEQVRDALKGLDPKDRERTTLDVWLESPGGDAHSAYKIGLIFRSVASVIRIVVPDYAKSAATLLSLVGDEIYMAPAAELGPLDAQVNYEQEGITISALDRARGLDDLAQAALEIALNGGGMILQYTRLSRAESITAMLDFSAKFMEPVMAKIDPTMLHYSNSLLRVAKEYGQRLMATRNDCPPGLANAVPEQLLEGYPTHGFVVSLEEARELGLPVRPMSEYENLTLVQHAYSEAERRGLNFIAVVPLEPSTVQDKDKDEDGGGEPDGKSDGNADDAGSGDPGE
jgi:hypothetical protein